MNNVLIKKTFRTTETTQTTRRP